MSVDDMDLPGLWLPIVAVVVLAVLKGFGVISIAWFLVVMLPFTIYSIVLVLVILVIALLKRQ